MKAQAWLILNTKLIGYLPEHYATPWVQTGQLVAIEGFYYFSEFYLLTRSSQHRSQLIAAFIEDLLSTTKNV